MDMTTGQGRGLLRPFMDLSLQLAQDRDLERVLKVVVDKAMEMTGARYGAALTVGPSGEIERFVQRGEPQAVAGLPPTPRGEGLLGEVLTRRRPLRLDRIADHPAAAGLPGARAAMESFLSVPLERAGDLIGALYLTKEAGRRPFTADDEELALALARIAAVAIDDARHLAEQAQHAQRTTLLRAAATRIRHSLEVAEVLDTTVKTLGLLAGVDRCSIRLMSDGKLGPVSHEWVAPGVEPLLEHTGPPPEVSLRAALTGTTQWTEDLLAGAGRGDLSLVAARGVLAAPLRWGDEVLGVVSFHSLEPRVWTTADIELIEDAAREVSVALHHGSLYAEQRAAAQRLEDLDRLRSDFIAMVSHELRSPMAVIVGIADIMSKRIDELSREQRDELLATLSREARRLARLVSEVLDVEALDRGGLKLRLSDVDLTELVREAVADSGAAERIEMSLPTQRAVVLGDPDRIKQVLINLITNAAKYAPDDRIDVSLTATGGGWVTSVRDRGPGIPSDQRARVFQRFARLEGTGARPGSGLGLYLARALVEAHGGEIWVEDAPDGLGSVFAFRLPGPGAPA